MTRKVAVVAFKLREIRSDAAYFGHLHDLVSVAHDKGADTVVFPELHVMELLPIVRDVSERNGPAYLAQYAQPLEDWFARIATSSGMTLVAGSHFREDPERGVLNVGGVAVPGKSVVLAEKNNLTRYEREVWRLVPGRGLVVTEDGVGVTICYDVEFPNSGRALAESGVWVHAVPAWTESRHGFQRVRWSCLARAVEHQIFVAHASLVGQFGYEPVPQSYGSSAIIAPSAAPFPDDVLLAETPLNEEGVVMVELDHDRLDEARTQSEVANWADRDGGTWTVRIVPGVS